MLPFLPTGSPSYNSGMAFTVTLRDHTVERVDGADAYTPERSLTTFFRTANARGAVDCWSVALASFRTDEILVIRRCGESNARNIEDSALAVQPAQRACNRSAEHAIDRGPLPVV